MKRNMRLIAIVISIILSSCGNTDHTKLIGYWGRYDNQVRNKSFPYQLHFTSDSLYMIDEAFFTHGVKYEIDQDNLIFFYIDGSKQKVNFAINTDRELQFDSVEFLPIEEDNYTKVYHYTLIGFKTNEVLSYDAFEESIHIIKVKERVQLILDANISDLKSIRKYFNNTQKDTHAVNIYLAEGIEFMDLLNAYKWLQDTGIKQVNLITYNEGYKKFFVLNDQIEIENNLMLELFFREGERPSPPRELKVDKDFYVISYKDYRDINKLSNLNDSVDYLVQVDSEVSILDYLKLTLKIQHHENLIKEINSLQPSI